LFLSVNLLSKNLPQKLKIAFENSSRVISVWDGEKLLGLIRGLERVLDVGIPQSTIDCSLVNPKYQGQQIRRNR
jgi:hypothetical protein